MSTYTTASASGPVLVNSNNTWTGSSEPPVTDQTAIHHILHKKPTWPWHFTMADDGHNPSGSPNSDLHRRRNITPKIQALKAMFEHRHKDQAKDTNSESGSPAIESYSPVLYSPLPVPGATSAPVGIPNDKIRMLDERVFDSWDTKFNAIVSCANDMYDDALDQYMQSVVFAPPADMPASMDDIEGVRSAELLTPEQDLAECMNRSIHCHVAYTYFHCKTLKAALQLSEQRQLSEDETDKMNAAADIVGTSDCRVPLVMRIQAIHITTEQRYGYVMDSLRDAWLYCHQLKTTPLMLSLMHRTQQLWVEVFGSLRDLPDHSLSYPPGGYAARKLHF